MKLKLLAVAVLCVPAFAFARTSVKKTIATPAPVQVAPPEAVPAPVQVAEPVMTAPVAASSNEPKDVKDTVVVPVLVESAFKPWLLKLHYSYLDLILPGKYGFAVARRGTENSMWEIEYTHGSFTPFFIDDIGKFTEDRISILRKFGSHGVEGFTWFYGAFYHRFKLEIGNVLMSRLVANYPYADVISISGLGVVAGVSYGWLFKEKYFVGIDAITYSQPLATLSRETKFLDVVSNSNDRDKVDTGISVMQYFPRFAIAKIVLGYNF